MDRVVAISDRTNAALHALALAARAGGSIAAREAAERLGVSSSYLAKVLQSLAAKGVIASTKGVGGGFSLPRPAGEVRLSEVVVALEGQPPARECLFEKAVCDGGFCVFKVFCAETSSRLRTILETTTIADLAQNFSDQGRPR